MFSHSVTSPLKRNRGSSENSNEGEMAEATQQQQLQHSKRFPKSRPNCGGVNPIAIAAYAKHVDPLALSAGTAENSSHYATPVSQNSENEEEERFSRSAAEKGKCSSTEHASPLSTPFTHSSSTITRSRASSHSSGPTPPPPPPCAAPSVSSSRFSSSYSDEELSDDEADEKDPRHHAEDVAKKYPMFTEAYAEKFRRDPTPFMRVVEAATLAPPGTTATSARLPEGDVPLSPSGSTGGGGTPRREKRFVLYDTYLYERTLGKGTFSKVVLGTATPAAQALSQQLSGDIPGRVALKVFRNKEEYIEASWDEFAILNSICVHPPTVTAAETTPSRTVTAGRRHSSLTTSPYISIRSVVMFAGSTCGIKQQYFADQGRFLGPLGYVAHPIHPAIVFPVMGATLLNVLNTIRQKSKEVTQSSKHKRPRTETEGCKGDSREARPSATAKTIAATTAVGPSSAKGEEGHSPPSQKRRMYYRGLPLPLLKAVLYQMLTFLQFVHCRGVVHTDLKPENVLFESVQMLSVDVGIYYTHYTRHESCGMSGAGASANLSAKKLSHDAYKLHSSSLERRAQRNEQVDSEAGSPSLPLERSRTSATTREGHNARQPLHPLEEARITGTSSSSLGFGSVPTDVMTSHGGDVSLAHYVRVPLPVMNSIRVVDLGIAQFLSTFRDHSLIPGYAHVPVSYNPIQTSHYRSPEVLLGLGWSTSADIFSLGCMIPELLTGDCLFMPNSSMEHLAMMQHIIAPFHDKDGIRNGTATNLRSVFACNLRTFRHFFTHQSNNRDFELRWPVTRQMVQDRANQQRFSPMANGKVVEEEGLEQLVETLPEDVEYVTRKPTLEEILAPLPDLLDLTRRMLNYHPFKRITAEEAMRHPFFLNM